MPDDLLTTVKARQRTRHELGIGSGGSPYDETVREIDALLARCEEAEDERDAARAEVDQLHTVRKRRDDEIAGLEDALTAERIENTHLREAFVTMERAANEREREVERLRKALADIATHPHSNYDHPKNGSSPYGTGYADGHRCAANVARAALDTPAREGGEGR